MCSGITGKLLRQVDRIGDVEFCGQSVQLVTVLVVDGAGEAENCVGVARGASPRSDEFFGPTATVDRSEHGHRLVVGHGPDPFDDGRAGKWPQHVRPNSTVDLDHRRRILRVDEHVGGAAGCLSAHQHTEPVCGLGVDQGHRFDLSAVPTGIHRPEMAPCGSAVEPFG